MRSDQIDFGAIARNSYQLSQQSIQVVDMLDEVARIYASDAVIVGCNVTRNFASAARAHRQPEILPPPIDAIDQLFAIIYHTEEISLLRSRQLNQIIVNIASTVFLATQHQAAPTGP